MSNRRARRAFLAQARKLDPWTWEDRSHMAHLSAADSDRVEQGREAALREIPKPRSSKGGCPMTRRATKRTIARHAATIGVGVFDPEEKFPGCASPAGPDWKAIYADSNATRLLGGVVVLLPSHRDITVPESSELLRKQAAALREFADAIDAVAGLPVPTTKGILS